MGHWMFECKEISQLVSESMDRKLPLYRRLGIRFHLMMCKLCTRYEKQLQFIRDAAHHFSKASGTDELSCPLTEDTKNRMKKEINKACSSE